MDIGTFCQEAEGQVPDMAMAFGYVGKTLDILNKPEHVKARRELFEGLYNGAIEKGLPIDNELAFLGARHYIIGLTLGSVIVSTTKNGQASTPGEICGSA